MEDEDSRHGYTIDEALSAMGFGNFQGFALVFAGIGWFTDAMEISLLSFIGPAVKSKWLLSPTQESLLSSAVFAGMFLGAFFWGFIADSYGRRVGIRGVAVAMFGAGLLSAFSPNYISLVIFRFFLGFGAGGGHVFSSWFLEFIPKVDRGTWMLVISVFWILGEMLEASLAWIIMPRLGWRWLLALSSLPSLTALLFSYFVPESPRYLYTKGRINEATTVLEKVASINRKEIPRGNLQTYVQLNEENVPSEEAHLRSLNENKTTSFQTWLKPLFELFSSDLRLTTLLLWFLSFVNTFEYYGLQLMISSLSSGESDCAPLNSTLSNKLENHNLYVNSFITYLAELPGLVIAGIFVDSLGRKRSMGMLMMVGVVIMLPLLFHVNGTVTTALLVSARTVLSAAFAILAIYGKEVYPTSARASGWGLSTAVGRTGGIVCPLIAVGLVRGCHQTLAVIMFGTVILISVVCVVFFPFETKGKGLTDIVSNSE